MPEVFSWVADTLFSLTRYWAVITFRRSSYARHEPWEDRLNPAGRGQRGEKVMREWKWRTVYQRRQEIWAERKKRMRQTAERGRGSHLARVSVREWNGCADRRSHTHTHTHTHPLLSKIFWCTHTLTFGHTALRPIFNPNSITVTKAGCSCNVQYVWRASPAVLFIYFFFFFRFGRSSESDRGQVLVYFQETFKATSELVATYNKCQDRKQRDFSASGFPDRCLIVPVLDFIGV